MGHSAFDWLLRLEFPEETANSQSLDNSSISVIKYNKGRWILEKYNVQYALLHTTNLLLLLSGIKIKLPKHECNGKGFVNSQ